MNIKSYKKGVWEVFSLYIRARDADNNGICTCCTCSKKLFWRGVECQAGHFVSGRTNNILFDEQIVHAQCSHCNQYLSGNVWEYGKFLRMKYAYSYNDLDELHSRKHTVRLFTLEELKQLKNKYKSLLIDITNKKGLIL